MMSILLGPCDRPYRPGIGTDFQQYAEGEVVFLMRNNWDLRWKMYRQECPFGTWMHLYGPCPRRLPLEEL